MVSLQKGPGGEYVFTPAPKGRVYTMSGIFIGTLIGGPLAAGYMIEENFKALELYDQANWPKQAGAIAMLVIFGGSVMFPEGVTVWFPAWLVVSLYTIGSTFLAKKIQGHQIRQLVLKRRQRYSFWQVLVVGVGSLAISLGLIVMLKMMAYYFAPFKMGPG